jgi:Spy/CpxP family protein refolding chaperone
VSTTTVAGTTLATTTAATASTAAVTAYTAAGAALNAGFSALASSAAVSFVNNGGDLGKTLKDLGSKDSVKNILISMATAGALNELGNAKLIGDKALNQITVADGFGANLGKSLINNMASATMNSALTGAKLEDSLKTALTSAVISAGAGQAASTIGDMTKESPAVKALAHALAGCMAGAAGSGSQGCQSGAIGAVVGELAAQWYDPTGNKPKGETLEFVKVVSAAAGAITGDGSAQSVNTAVMTGVNAAENNYLKHTQVAQLADKLKICGTDANCKNGAMDEAYRQSAANDSALLNCKATNNCDQLKADYRQGMQAIVNLMDSGLPSTDVTRILSLENTAQVIIRYGLDQKICATAACKDNASYLTGVGKGLAKITPVGMAVGTGVMAYELTMALANNGAVDTAVKVAQGVQDLPATIRSGLNSSDPSVRGEALVDALSLGALGAALGTKIAAAGVVAASPAVVAALDKSATNALIKSGGAVDALTGNTLLDMSTLSNAQKGAMGDLFGASTVKQIVPEGQKLARIQGVGTTGIDDLYKVNRPDVDYVVIEYKFVGQDSKMGAQVLGNTNDGLQGSLGWIGGSNRIEKAVGGSTKEALQIRDAIEAGRAESWVVTTRPDGSTSVQVLDAMGKPKPTDTSKILSSGVNLSGAKP